MVEKLNYVIESFVIIIIIVIICYVCNCLLLFIHLIVMFILFYKIIVLLILGEQLCQKFAHLGHPCCSQEIKPLVSSARVLSHPLAHTEGVQNAPRQQLGYFRKRDGLFFEKWTNKHVLTLRVGLSPSRGPKVLNLSRLSQNVTGTQPLMHWHTPTWCRLAYSHSSACFTMCHVLGDEGPAHSINHRGSSREVVVRVLSGFEVHYHLWAHLFWFAV